MTMKAWALGTASAGAALIGLTVGRAVSLMTDGIPHPILIAMFIVEVLFACVAVRLLMRHREPATTGTRT